MTPLLDGVHNQSLQWAGFSFTFSFCYPSSYIRFFFDSNQVFLNKQFIGILLASMLGFLLGLADDAYNTKPMLKLSTQITCAVILLVSGTEITISYLEVVNYIITIFWVVGIMNSLNMLDNMDAITSTVSISIILSALCVMIFHRELNSVYFLEMLGVMGALIGFLFFNWHPSKMYMGDTGSQFLGVFLAAMGIRYFWNAEPPSGDFISARNLFLPLIVFIMPIIDTTTVVINRISRRQNPFVGEKKITPHMPAAYLGLSDRQVALVFWAITLISLMLVVVMERFLKTWSHVYSALFAIYFFLMFGIFFYASKVASRNKK
ncbi:MAG: MraY family glycosyltransferase [Bacteroidia bacterium]